MKYAIELYFDRETEKILFDLSQRVAEEGISMKFSEWKTRPHLTLACYNDLDEQKCIEQLKQFAQRYNPFPAYIGSIGMFPDTGTIFTSPVMNKNMYRMQAELHDLLKEYDTKGFEWYLPERWAPHCTLALTNEDGENAFYRASNLLLREFRKTCGEFVAIGLVRITCPVKEIFTTELSK